MSLDPSQLSLLQAIYPDARQVEESSQSMVLLPTLKVALGSEFRAMKGLLHPGPHSGYTTRLFLSETLQAERPVIGSSPANWTTHILLGHAWHTWSWNQVPASLPLVQILIAHLDALR